MRKYIALAIVGMAGAGKSTVASYFRDLGWSVLRFGGITISELTARGLDISEMNERALREEIRKAEGMAAFAKRLWPGIDEAGKRNHVVLDGLYSWSEYLYLKPLLGTRLVTLAVTASRKTRYSRLSVRKERPLSFTEAEQRDLAEIEQLEKAGPIAMADYTIVNDHTENDLIKTLKTLLGEILSEGVVIDGDQSG